MLLLEDVPLNDPGPLLLPRAIDAREIGLSKAMLSVRGETLHLQILAGFENWMMAKKERKGLHLTVAVCSHLQCGALAKILAATEPGRHKIMSSPSRGQHFC